MLEEGADALGGVAALKHSLVPVEQHLGGGVTGSTLGSTRPHGVLVAHRDAQTGE
jgi:hypothetical protein